MASNKPHYEAEQDGVTDNGTEFTFKPRGLNIVWGNDPRYWQMPSKEKDDAAELVQVSWLEVTGSTPRNLDRGKKYEISFKVSMKQGAFGWNGCPVFMMAKIGKRGRYTWKRIKLSDMEAKQDPFDIPEEKFVIEVPQGASNDESRLHFGLYEVWTGKWKGGLLIHGAKVQIR